MNNLSLVLKIFDFKFDHNDISTLIGLTPTEIHKEGDNYYIGPSHNRILKKYSANYWEYRICIKKNTEWIKTVIDSFANEIIIKNVNALAEIKNECKMEFYVEVVFCQNGNLDSFHFDTALLNVLARLNIELDIDQYLFENLD